MLNTIARSLAFLFVSLALATAGCDRTATADQNAFTGSKLTPANYKRIKTGMPKALVERIMGPPTTVETKGSVIFRRTSYRYEEGARFAMFTFKNNKLDSKDGNLAAQPQIKTAGR